MVEPTCSKQDVLGSSNLLTATISGPKYLGSHYPVYGLLRSDKNIDRSEDDFGYAGRM